MGDRLLFGIVEQRVANVAETGFVDAAPTAEEARIDSAGGLDEAALSQHVAELIPRDPFGIEPLHLQSVPRRVERLPAYLMGASFPEAPRPVPGAFVV